MKKLCTLSLIALLSFSNINIINAKVINTEFVKNIQLSDKKLLSNSLSYQDVIQKNLDEMIKILYMLEPNNTTLTIFYPSLTNNLLYVPIKTTSNTYTICINNEGVKRIYNKNVSSVNLDDKMKIDDINLSKEQLEKAISLNDNKIIKADLAERQINNAWCLSYVTAQWLRTKGVNVKAKDIVNAYKDDYKKQEDLRKLSPQIRYMNEYILSRHSGIIKIDAVFNTSNLLRDLKNQIDNSNPIILSMKKEDNADNINHAILAIGYSKNLNYLFYYNPWEDYIGVNNLNSLDIKLSDKFYTISQYYIHNENMSVSPLSIADLDDVKPQVRPSYNTVSKQDHKDDFGIDDYEGIEQGVSATEKDVQNSIKKESNSNSNSNSNNIFSNVKFSNPKIPIKTTVVNPVNPVNTKNTPITNITPYEKSTANVYNYSTTTNFNVFSRTSTNPNAKSYNLSTGFSNSYMNFSNNTGNSSISNNIKYSNPSNVTISYN